MKSKSKEKQPQRQRQKPKEKTKLKSKSNSKSKSTSAASTSTSKPSSRSTSKSKSTSTSTSTSTSRHSKTKIVRQKRGKRNQKPQLGREENTTEKIQKVLSRVGVASRREIERWITAGRINVNGKIAQLGDRIDHSARIKIDGKLLRMSRAPQRTRILLYHKPSGEVCTRSDPKGRPTVFGNNSRLKSHRWIMVGRLDFNTSGLLLFTNNGELANKLMHPSSEIEREYAVRVWGVADSDVLMRLKKGVKLEDGPAHFESVVDGGGQGKNHWYKVILKEGRNREVRRLWESQGFTVTRLIRTRFASIPLSRSLRQGKISELTPDEVKAILEPS